MSISTKDAVKIIKAGGWGYPECDITEANLMAIDALEHKSEAEEYRTPKKVKIRYFKDLYESSEYEEISCPACHVLFEDFVPGYDKPPKYCIYCGQALDWSEVEDGN